MTWFIQRIPAGLVRFFAARYIAGVDMATAVDAAADLHESRGIDATLSLLAEDVRDERTVAQNRRTLQDLIAAIAADERFPADRRPTVSVKLSSFTSAPLDRGGNAAGADDAVRDIVASAASHGIGVTLDMESRHWTDHTLGLLASLHRDGHAHTGAVLQTRLLRTDADLAVLPAGSRVRLVIGIYDEPAAIALRDKRAMKSRLLRFAERLLDAGHYVEFATHDEATLLAFAEMVSTRPAGGCEVQLLHGVPCDRIIARLKAQGIPVRIYLPFALSWPLALAYLRRRLAESPRMMWPVLWNFIRSRGQKANGA